MSHCPQRCTHSAKRLTKQGVAEGERSRRASSQQQQHKLSRNDHEAKTGHHKEPGRQDDALRMLALLTNRCVNHELSAPYTQR